MIALDSKRLNNILKAALEELPSLLVALSDRSGNIFEFAGGKMDITKDSDISLDSLLRIFSASKILSATLAFQLIERGRLSLDDEVRKYVPEISDIKVLKGFSNGEPILARAQNQITIKHLLLHTSGFGYEFFDKQDLAFREYFKIPSITTNTPAALHSVLLHEPGSAWRYGISIDWLGRVIENIYNDRLANIMRNNIFIHCNMQDSYFDVSRENLRRIATIHSREIYDEKQDPLDFLLCRDNLGCNKESRGDNNTALMLSESETSLHYKQNLEFMKIQNLDSKDSLPKTLDSKDSSAEPQNDNNFQYDDNHNFLYDDNHRHVERSETSTWNLDSKDSSHAFKMTIDSSGIRPQNDVGCKSNVNYENKVKAKHEIKIHNNASCLDNIENQNSISSVMLSGGETSFDSKNQNLDSSLNTHNDVKNDAIRLKPAPHIRLPLKSQMDMAGHGLHCSMQDFMKFLRAILNDGMGENGRILRKETLDFMCKGAFDRQNINNDMWNLGSAMPFFSRGGQFYPNVRKNWGYSFQVSQERTPTGRVAGSIMWAGITNLFYFIDRQNGIAGCLSTQTLPFLDTPSLRTYYMFESMVYSGLS